jgi:transposase
MAKTRRKLDADFPEGAARLVRETGKPITQVAAHLRLIEPEGAAVVP